MNLDGENPENTLGDEYGPRSHGGYGYQAACAAFLSLDLLKEPATYDRVYCEHHDDIMMRKTDGTYSYIQVKTRGSSRERIKTSDNEILNSLTNFIRIFERFPNHISEFFLITNCGFWGERKTHDNFDHVLELFKHPGSEKRAPMKGAFAKLLKNLKEVSKSRKVVFEVLRKMKPRVLPERNSIELHIAKKIREIFNLGNTGYDVVGRAAKRLIMEMDQKGQVHTDVAPNLYEILLEDRQSQIELAVIRDKQVTKQMVEQTVTQSVGPRTVLRPMQPVDPNQLPLGMNLMEEKMACGGLSIENIEHLTDCKHSAEAFFLSWVETNAGLAIEHYNDKLMKVRTVCLESHDSVSDSSRSYGMDMLRLVRDELKNGSYIGPEGRDMEYELLLGVTGMLTETCKVWWSPRFATGGST